MPPAWVDFSWVLVQVKRDDVKQNSVVVIKTLDRVKEMDSKAPTPAADHLFDVDVDDDSTKTDTILSCTRGKALLAVMDVLWQIRVSAVDGDAVKMKSKFSVVAARLLQWGPLHPRHGW
jgi:hypothetical protein